MCVRVENANQFFLLGDAIDIMDRSECSLDLKHVWIQHVTPTVGTLRTFFHHNLEPDLDC